MGQERQDSIWFVNVDREFSIKVLHNVDKIVENFGKWKGRNKHLFDNVLVFDGMQKLLYF